MDPLTALTDRALIDQLSRLDISVPAIGRTKEHTERWSICRFLSTFANSTLISYPFTLIHGDKPDFRLQLPTESVGIEVTAAMPEQYGRALAILRRKYPEGVLDADELRWGAPNRTTAELEALIDQWQSRLTGMGWVGEQVEHEWADAISHSIANKLAKLNRDGFHKSHQNWLLIYDNVPTAALNLNRALQLFHQLVPSLPAWAHHYQLVVIETHDQLVAVSNGSHTIHQINDLWH